MTTSLNHLSSEVYNPPPPAVISPVINGSVSPSKAPLGIRAKFASPSKDDVTKNRFRLQAAAARLLPSERVAGCLRDLRYGSQTVDVMYSPSVEAAHYKGLQTCGSIWACSVCAAKITELRRQELTLAMRNARAKGWDVVMATYTQRHKRYQGAAALLTNLRSARRRFKSGKGFQALKARYGFIHSVNALEVTHTEANGWHVHVHEAMIFDHKLSEAEIQGAEADFKRRWVSVADADLGHGFDLQAGNQAVEDYIAKFGREPKNTGWTLEHEITKNPVKKASPGGRTPFGLLEAYDAGDMAAGELFKEFVAAFKGAHQLHWSKGLKALLGVQETTDEELAESVQADAVVVVWLHWREWRVVLGNDCRAELLAFVRECRGDPDPVWEWLAELGVFRHEQKTA